ncbi:dipeptidase PepV [soil metagenome]
MEIAAPEQIKDRLQKILQLRDDELMRDSIRILTFETVSGGTPEQEKKYREQIPECYRWLEKVAMGMGFNFRHWDHRVAEIEWALEPIAGEGKRPTFGIASHIDVVTPAGNWTHPPFAGQVADGVLYGRGTQDDKGPLIQALYGMYAAKEAGIRPCCDVRLIIGSSEETGDWSDIDLYLKKRGAPDYSFTPDADFPIITGEKGMINVRFMASWPRVAPHGETHMEFVSLNGGSRSNIVPAGAEATLRFPVENKHDVMKEMVRETTRYTVENRGSNITLIPNNEKDSEGAGYYEALISFIGKAAHSSTPAKGHNAITDSLRFFADIETLPDDVRNFIRFLAIIASETDGSTIGIDHSHAFVGDTTAVLSILQIGQNGGEGLLNVRPTMGQSPQEVLEKAHLAAAAYTKATGLQIDVEPRDGRMVEAIFLDPEKPGVGKFLGSLQSAYTLATGRPAETVAIGGTTYAKALPNCCAFGPVLPGVDEELAHQADERMALESIRRNALIYGLSIALMK